MSNNIRNYIAEAAVSPYRIVKFGTEDGAVKHAAAATDNSIGVTTEVGGDINDRVDVIYTGPAKVEAGGTFTKGDQLTSDSQGRAIKADLTAGGNIVVIGQAFESAVSGDIVDFDITKSMINTDIAEANTEIGTLVNLTTTEKTNLVGAINEVDEHADAANTSIGTLANLTTTEKTSLVGAINEVDANANTALGRVATTQADSVATTIADLKTDFNTLLGKLKTAGLMAAE